MPTQITVYRCDICGEDYDTEELAKECEDLGTPIGMKPGLIFSLVSKPGAVIAVETHHRSDAHYSNWTGWLCETDKPIVGPMSAATIRNKSDLADPRQYATEYDRMLAHVREQLPGERLMYFDGEFARDVE